MAQQSNDLRERLLAALPQPENLAAYREETAALLAKHARALRWDKFTAIMFAFLAVAMVCLWNHGPWRPGTLALIWLQVTSAVFFFMGVIYSVRYEIYDRQVATLKEIKQVQLQILELQASLRKDQ
jgi:p-aminobenzoyl-glutamate transporter AbgT